MSPSRSSKRSLEVRGQVRAVLAALEAMSTTRDRENLSRFGITANKAFGVSDGQHAGAGQASRAQSRARRRALGDRREAPSFTAAERAALALIEAVTRLSGRSDPVPDTIWDEAVRHYDERALGALVLSIATTNLFNRLNVTTRQLVGAKWEG
jgi:hypothetical protein